MKLREGPDFYVCYFSDASTNSSMGIYVGHHPDLASEAGIAVQRYSGRVGDVSVEWLHWSQDGRCRSETLVRGFFGQGSPRALARLVLHIFMSAPSELEVSRMEAAAATFRLGR